LNISGVEGISSVVVIGLIGNSVAKSISGGQVDISDLNPGVYFIKISQQQSMRFIKL
jgi:hypothetical protein